MAVPVQPRQSRLDGVVQDGLDLQLVLVVGVPLCQVPELLCQVDAVADVLRRHKVLGHLNAVVQVAHLVAGAGRDEDGVAHALHDGVAGDAVVAAEALPQRPVQVGGLVVDGVVVRVQAPSLLYGHALQEGAYGGGVARVVDVPQGAGQLG